MGKQRFGKRTETERELYNRLFNAVARYLFENFRDDVEVMFDFDWGNIFQEGLDDSQESPLIGTFFDWLIHTDSILETGVTGIELFLDDNPRLTDRERSMLNTMHDSVISLFEITVSETRESAVHRDLLLGGEFTLDELEIPSGYTMGLMAGRRMTLDGQAGLGIGYYPFDLGIKDEILEEIRDGLEYYRESEPDAGMETYLKNADPFPDMWLESFEDEEEGDFGDVPEETKSAIFQLLGSQAEILEKLRAVSSLREGTEEDHVFMWITGREDEAPEQYGAIALTDAHLILSAFTPELLEAGKIMLLSNCSGLIRHLHDMDFDTKQAFGYSGEEE